MHGPDVRRVAVAVHQRVPGVRLPVQGHRDHGPLSPAHPDHPRLLLGGLADPARAAVAATVIAGEGVLYRGYGRRRLPAAAAAGSGDYRRDLDAVGGRRRLGAEMGRRRLTILKLAIGEDCEIKNCNNPCVWLVP